MKANELRIGNLVLLPCEGHEDELVSINKYDFEEPYNFNPIPLTEEILLNCGFKCKHSGTIIPGNIKKYTYELRYDDISLPISFNKDGLYCHHGKHIKNVHQLQNLYFALTGEELEIQL